MHAPAESWRERPLDLALALGLACAGAAEIVLNDRIAPKPAAWACELALGLVLLARRRYPTATVIAVAALATSESLAGVPMDAPWLPLAATLAAVYTLVSRAPLDRALAGTAISLLGVAVQVVDQHKGFGNFAFGVAFVGPIFAAARAVRVRTERAASREREHVEQSRAAVEDERRRIARDLHDVISHSLGIVVLQAGAAEQVLPRNPMKARELLASIRATGQQAVAELGALLAVTNGAPADSLDPAPSLSELPHLTDRMRAAGLNVRLETSGTSRPLPSALEVSAYRIVQEALTNVAKHAGRARAVVRLDYTHDALCIEVVDDGTSGGRSATGQRRGLVGMHERACLFGGTVEAGPHPDGGWRVGARLPVEP